MGKLVIIDTNVLILALGGKEPYASFLRQLIREKRLLLSVIVISEFLSGATEEEERIFSALTQKFPVISVDLLVAQLAAYFRKKYLQSKKKPLLPDCLIAASCRLVNASLATLDKRDYPFKEIKIIDFP